MKVTKQEIKMKFKGYDITIPKGTRVTSQTACGLSEDYNFIDDLSWIPLVDGIKQFGLIHDATHTGINISADLVEEKKMIYPFYEMTQAMIDRLNELGAVTFTVFKNNSDNTASSVHFYSSESPDESGIMNEVAYFSPDMHSYKLGKLSGFNEIERLNFTDVNRFGFEKIPWDDIPISAKR